MRARTRVLLAAAVCAGDAALQVLAYRSRFIPGPLAGFAVSGLRLFILPWLITTILLFALLYPIAHLKVRMFGVWLPRELTLAVICILLAGVSGMIVGMGIAVNLYGE